jgi:hypothetical protein
MLNVMVAQYNTNPQYQTLVDPETREYKVGDKGQYTMGFGCIGIY